MAELPILTENEYPELYALSMAALEGIEAGETEVWPTRGMFPID